MLSKGRHRSHTSIFNKLWFELHTRGEGSLLLQMLPAGARTSFSQNTAFLGDIFGPFQLNQTWRKTRKTTHRGCSGKLGELLWGDAPEHRGNVFQRIKCPKIPVSQLPGVLNTAHAASLNPSIRQAQRAGMKLERVLQHHPHPALLISAGADRAAVWLEEAAAKGKNHRLLAGKEPPLTP